MRLSSLLFFLLASFISFGQLNITLESGLVFTQYNDVRVPNESPDNLGTLFSFRDDFTNDSNTSYLRLELLYRWKNKHAVELVAAPLTVDYGESTITGIRFADTNFGRSTASGRYQFNTYRLSYRYRVLDRSRWRLDLGGTVLTRDAEIRLSTDGVMDSDSDLGFVPLVSFDLAYLFNPSFSFLLKGDALVGPVGRAEDIFAGFLYSGFGNRLSLKAGYRLIEGGADVDQVYNFAFFHFASIGFVLTI